MMGNPTMNMLTRRGALLACLLLAAFCPPAWGQDNPLVQRGVPAEATAENAVQARERAFAAARRAAWQRLAAATGSTQNPSDAQLESMTRAIIVESERTSGTRYVGRLTVQFASGTAGVTGSSAIASSSVPVPRGPAAAAAAPAAAPPAGEGVASWSPPAGPLVASIEATSTHGSLPEWIELRRRLLASAPVSAVEVQALSMDAARLRISLRAQPGEAQAALMEQGFWVDGAGPAWRIGLAGTR